MNIKNSKKVKIRNKLQTITNTFPDFRYDMETVNDEWLIHFTSNKNKELKFMIEISSVDEKINNFKYFFNNKWISYESDEFNEIINIAKNKIIELYD